MPIKVLSLDQSTSITGIAVGSTSDSLRNYLFGSIKIPKAPEFGERLAHLHQQLDASIRQHKPDLIAYETPVLMLHGAGGINRQESFAPARGFLAPEAFSAARKSPHVFNPTTMMQLQKVAGIIECLAGLHGIPVEDYAAASWRKTVLGSGRAPKDAPDGWLKKAVKDRMRSLGYDVKDDNEADALGILIHALTGPEAAQRAQGDLMAMARL